MRFYKLTCTTLAALALATSSALAQPFPHNGPPPGPNQGPPPESHSAPPFAHFDHHGPFRPHTPYFRGPYAHPPMPPPGGWRPGHHFGGPYRFMPNYGFYHLPPPPPGYGWVYAGNQFLMIAMATGIIASVVAAQAY